jgi:DHA1 family tetracycline resistance protein-like MFS transporter
MSETSRKPAVRFIFVTLLLDVIGFGLLIPVGPRLVQSLQGPGASPETAGWPVTMLAVTFAVMMFVFSPILGSLSDRFGRRSVLLVALLGSGLDYFAQALAPSLAVLFITRALNGVSGSSMTVCNAYIADITPPEKRAGAFGMIGAAFGIGFIVGPLMGGGLFALANLCGTHAGSVPAWAQGMAQAVGEHAVRVPFWAAGLLCIVNWAYGWFVLPESLPLDKRREFKIARSHPIAAISHLFKYPVVIGLAAALFLLNVAQFGLHITWALYTQHRYQWSPMEIGFSLFLVGLGAAVVQGGLARKIIPALGERRSVLLGCAIAVVAFTGYGLATHGWMIYVMVLAFSLGGIAGPACQAIITKAVPADQQGETQGAMTSMNSIAAVIGPFLGGSVFSYFISDKAPFHLPGAPYFVGAGLSAVGLWLAWRALSGNRATVTPVTTSPSGGTD